MFVKIAQPDPKKINSVKVNKVLEDEAIFSQLLGEVAKCNSPRYKSWEDNLKYQKHTSTDLNPEEFFSIVQFTRKISSKNSPVKQEDGTVFKWQELDRFQKFFDQFSKDFGVRDNAVLSHLAKETLRKKNYEGIIEEAIASSQIEGATVTREQGREMLKSNKAPKSVDERMILNNYSTIQKIETEWQHEKMSLDLLLKIQKSLTKETLKDPKHEGSFRKKEDSIEVGNELTGDIAFIPPSNAFVRKELKKFVKFANEEFPYDDFLWDIARAIIMHFWIAYLHPFCDGNGRTARAVFYWYLLRKNFLYIGFLPISVRIKKSKTSYEKSFLLVEQDGNNLTYFFDYIIRQMQLSIKDFYVFEKTQEESRKQQSEIEEKLSDFVLNQRQVELIHYFLKNPNDFTTLIRHQHYQKITYVTSRRDLYDLNAMGFLETKKKEKTIYFYPTAKIREYLLR